MATGARGLVSPARGGIYVETNQAKCAKPRQGRHPPDYAAPPELGHPYRTGCYKDVAPTALRPVSPSRGPRDAGMATGARGPGERRRRVSSRTGRGTFDGAGITDRLGALFFNVLRVCYSGGGIVMGHST